MATRFTGYVKWFDPQKGFGFIVEMDSVGNKVGTDRFVHYTNLESSVPKKRLETGEYVEFSKGTITIKDSVRDVAVHVTGIRNNKLMCDHKFNCAAS